MIDLIHTSAAWPTDVTESDLYRSPLVDPTTVAERTQQLQRLCASIGVLFTPATLATSVGRANLQLVIALRQRAFLAESDAPGAPLWECVPSALAAVVPRAA